MKTVTLNVFDKDNNISEMSPAAAAHAMQTFRNIISECGVAFPIVFFKEGVDVTAHGYTHPVYTLTVESVNDISINTLKNAVFYQRALFTSKSQITTWNENELYSNEIFEIYHPRL